MKRIIRHFFYLAFFLLGIYIAFSGVEDLGLLLFGTITDAKVVSVSRQRIRVGKRGHGYQHYAKYAFTADNGKQYRGSGEMDSHTPHEPGVMMPIRYLFFRPSVNRPKDDVVGTGLLLVGAGALLAYVVLASWWRRKVSPAAEPKAAARARSGP